MEVVEGGRDLGLWIEGGELVVLLLCGVEKWVGKVLFFEIE